MTSLIPLIIGIDTFVLFLGLSSTALRFYARRISNTHLWLDDYFVAAGECIASVTGICHYIALSYGFGRHASELRPETVSTYLKLFYSGQMAWIASSTVVKLAVLLLYWRLFPSQTLKRVVYVMATFVSCYYIACTVTFILQCYPAYAFWVPTAAEYCINRNAFYMAAAVLGMCSDIVLVLTPIPILWKLNMSTKKKLQVCIVFFLGGCVCVISICRIFALNTIDPKDITWTNVGPGLWSASEVQIGVLCANLPPLRILLRRSKRDSSNFDRAYNKRTSSERSEMSHDPERNQGLVVYRQTEFEVR